MPKYRKIPTPVGTLLAWSNHAGHVGIRTENEHGRYDHNAPIGGWDGVASSVTLSRVAYRVHWHYEVPSLDSLNYDGANPLTRAEAFSLDNGTPNAVREFHDVITPAVREFLATREGRQMLEDGQREHDDNRRAELAKRETELAEELKTVRKELRKLRAVVRP